MSVFKRPGRKQWWCQYRFNGKLYRHSTGTEDKREAERYERAIRAKTESEAPPRRRGVGTLEDLGKYDIQRVETARRSDGQIKRVKDIWDELYFGLQKDSDPINITIDRVMGFISERQTDGLKNQSIRRELQALRRGLERAKVLGWISAIPEPWPKLANGKPNEARKGKRLDRATIKKLMAKLPDNAKDGVTFALSTGLRLHELWRVRRSMVGEAPAGSQAKAVLNLPDWSTKGRKPRVIGLNAEALAIVKKRAKKSEDEIFPKYDYTQAMKRAAEKLGMQGKGVHMRSLRHTFASEALQSSGGNLSAVGRALGHSELEVTTLYTHAHDHDVINLAQTAITINRSPKKKKKAKVKRK